MINIPLSDDGIYFCPSCGSEYTTEAEAEACYNTDYGGYVIRDKETKAVHKSQYCTTIEDESTHLNELTTKLDKYAFAKQSLSDTAYCAIAMGEESGEVLGKIKKWIRDDGNFPKNITPERRLQLLIESGDILFYWAYFIKSLDATPEEVLQLLIEKISSRQRRGTQHGEGDNR